MRRLGPQPSDSHCSAELLPAMYGLVLLRVSGTLWVGGAIQCFV